MTTVTLADPATGQPVELRTAQLSQVCRICGGEMINRLIVSVNDGMGWTHADHLERRLALLGMTLNYMAREQAAEQLKDVDVGEKFTMTRTVLIALGTGK